MLDEEKRARSGGNFVRPFFVGFVARFQRSELRAERRRRERERERERKITGFDRAAAAGEEIAPGSTYSAVAALRARRAEMKLCACSAGKERGRAEEEK